MQNPASPPKLMHTCPTCKRPVEPGYKFCEACGTHITELSTCSKCGTQFISTEKFCDLCGAPLIHGEVPEDNKGEDTGTVEEQAPELDEEEIPDKDSDEVPEDDEEEDTGTVEEQAPELDEEEIPEPYTDELLEQFGAEYSDEETVGSPRKPKPEPIDDALFFSHKMPGTPAKQRAGITWIIGGGVVLVALIAAVYFIGLPMLNGNGGFNVLGNPPAVEITPTPAPTSVVTIRPALTRTIAPVSRALFPLPTQLIPSDQKFYFQVWKNPVTLKISVIFTGSAGEDSIQSADIKVTQPDGAVSTGIIQPLKGIAEITLAGSEDADRVEIIAKMSSGGTYRVYDDLVYL
jgi:hypothetical protein